MVFLDNFEYEVNHEVSSEYCFGSIIYSQLIWQELSFETSDEMFYSVHTYATYPSTTVTGIYIINFNCFVYIYIYMYYKCFVNK